MVAIDQSMNHYVISAIQNGLWGGGKGRVPWNSLEQDLAEKLQSIPGMASCALLAGDSWYALSTTMVGLLGGIRQGKDNCQWK